MDALQPLRAVELFSPNVKNLSVYLYLQTVVSVIKLTRDTSLDFH